MPLSRSRERSELPNLTETNRLLHKIALLLASSPRHVVFAVGQSFRASAANLQNVVIDETLGSANIQFKRAPFSSVAASKVIQDLTYTAATAGAGGNSITIAYTTGATAGSEVVTVVGNAISVQIQSGVSTATQIRTAVLASGPAAALVGVTVSGTGSNAQTAPVAPTNLAGGITGNSVENYDTADIQIIKRLRTKKWLIRIKATANPA